DVEEEGASLARENPRVTPVTPGKLPAAVAALGHEIVPGFPADVRVAGMPGKGHVGDAGDSVDDRMTHVGNVNCRPVVAAVMGNQFGMICTLDKGHHVRRFGRAHL